MPQAAWITTDPTSGSGSARVRLDFAENTLSTSRAGTVIVAEQTVRITQAGVPQRVDIEGRVGGLDGACPALRFVVTGNRVYTDGDTKFEKVKCADLANGQIVRVRGIRDGTQIRAERVERRDDRDDGGDD